MHRAVVRRARRSRATRPGRGGQSWPGSTSPPGSSTRCPPPAGTPAAGFRPHRQTRLTLDADTTAALQAAARAHGLTLATVLYGAWALSVGALTGSAATCVVGTTVSGRDADVAGLDGPSACSSRRCRTAWPGLRRTPLAEVLRRGQDARTRLGDHQQVRLGDLARAAGHAELFDTLVVVENYVRPGVQVDVVDAVHYPVALIVVPGAELELVLKHDEARVGDDAAELVLAQLRRTLETLAADPTTPVAGDHAARGRPNPSTSRSPSTARRRWSAGSPRRSRAHPTPSR